MNDTKKSFLRAREITKSDPLIHQLLSKLIPLEENGETSLDSGSLSQKDGTQKVEQKAIRKLISFFVSPKTVRFIIMLFTLVLLDGAV